MTKQINVTRGLTPQVSIGGKSVEVVPGSCKMEIVTDVPSSLEPTAAVIAKARQIVENNIAFGDVDDDAATITTGGMIADVATILQELEELRHGRRR